MKYEIFTNEAYEPLKKVIATSPNGEYRIVIWLGFSHFYLQRRHSFIGYKFFTQVSGAKGVVHICGDMIEYTPVDYFETKQKEWGVYGFNVDALRKEHYDKMQASWNIKHPERRVI